MNKITGKKSFGVALGLWFVFGAFGAHRVYAQEKLHYLLWYWLGTLFSFGILPLVDVFFIKRMVIESNENVMKGGSDF